MVMQTTPEKYCSYKNPLGNSLSVSPEGQTLQAFSLCTFRQKREREKAMIAAANTTVLMFDFIPFHSSCLVMKVKSFQH